MKYIIHLLRVIIGCVFIYSAYTKLISIDSFEIFIYRHDFVNWFIASVFARLIISAELILGVLMLLNLFTVKVLRLSIIMLTAFTLYLFYVIITGEDVSNCNCFGSELILSPKESVLKNVILIILCIVTLIKSIQWNFKYKKLILYSVLIISTVLPFIISFPDLYFKKKYSYGDVVNSKIDKEVLGDFVCNNKKYDIFQEKCLLCFFSMSCKMCKLSAQKISIIHKKSDSVFPVYYVFFGDEQNLDNFWSSSQSTKFPYKIIGVKEFFELSDNKLPTIYFLEKGIIKKKVGYRTLFEEDINTFFHE